MSDPCAAPHPTLERDLIDGTAFPFGDATYRRRISIRPHHDDGRAAPGGRGHVDAEMEDYVHHFAIRVDHADGVVTAATADGVRHPWDACPGGANGIRRLVGTRLADAGARHGWFEDRLAQCVHVVDLAVLACGHADDPDELDLEILVPDAGHRHRTATMWRNGDELLSWTLKDNLVVAPERFAGMTISGGAFFRWIDEHLTDPVEHEGAVVLRRAAHIATSRGLDLDRYAVAADGGAVNDSCFVYRQEVAVRARRIVGTTRSTELDAPAPPRAVLTDPPGRSHVRS